MKLGVDVSKWQGNVNWSNVKRSGIDFAIVKAGYGKLATQIDPQFTNNYAGCKSNDVGIGVYWYSYAMSAAEAVEEAEACLQVIKGKTFDYPIFFDFEEPKQFALGKSKCTEIVKAFLEKVESAGYYVGLYGSKSSLTSYIDESIKKRFTIWLAHVGKSGAALEKTSYSGSYGMWQYSWKGKISGICGDVDMDRCYIDYPSAIIKAGLNGFGKSTVVPTPVPAPVVAKASHGVASCSKVKAGYKIQLNKMDLFVSSDATKKANTLTGFYYVSDGKIINGRFRICSKIGLATIGWIDKKYTNETG